MHQEAFKNKAQLSLIKNPLTDVNKSPTEKHVKTHHKKYFNTIVPLKPGKMGKPRYEMPTPTFPYKISRRLNIMSLPRPYYIDTGEGLPAYTPRGIRQSALRAHITDRLNDAAWPYLRRFLLLKRQYKNVFSKERLRKIDRMIELANSTGYSKLAKCTIDLKKNSKDPKKRRGWSESEWKKHMEYINQISGPRRQFAPPPVSRGNRKPLDELLQRINEISSPAEFKIYKRLSQEVWYKNPIKVSPGALKYVATDNIKKLATPKPIPPPE